MNMQMAMFSESRPLKLNLWFNFFFVRIQNEGKKLILFPFKIQVFHLSGMRLPAKFLIENLHGKNQKVDIHLDGAQNWGAFKPQRHQLWQLQRRESQMVPWSQRDGYLVHEERKCAQFLAQRYWVQWWDAASTYLPGWPTARWCVRVWDGWPTERYQPYWAAVYRRSDGFDRLRQNREESQVIDWATKRRLGRGYARTPQCLPGPDHQISRRCRNRRSTQARKESRIRARIERSVVRRVVWTSPHRGVDKERKSNEILPAYLQHGGAHRPGSWSR